MPGTGTLGKLFFKLFFNDLAARTRCSRKANRRDEHGGKAAFIVSRRPRLKLASEVPSRQENSPARAAATAGRFRRAPAG
jgi:hypothetical protein